jgi:hypothetical protein
VSASSIRGIRGGAALAVGHDMRNTSSLLIPILMTVACTEAPEPDATVAAEHAADPRQIAEGVRDFTLSPDQLELYGFDQENFFLGRATRVTTDAPFGALEPLDSFFGNDAPPTYSLGLSHDGLTLYFTADWPDGTWNQPWKVTRASLTGDWSEPTHLDYLGDALGVTECAGGAQLVYQTIFGIMEWRDGEIRELAELRAASDLDDSMPTTPWISSDCLTLYFVMRESDPVAGSLPRLWVAHRPKADELWGLPVALPELSRDGYIRAEPWVSPDHHTLVVSEFWFDTVEGELRDFKLLQFAR